MRVSCTIIKCSFVLCRRLPEGEFVSNVSYFGTDQPNLELSKSLANIFIPTQTVGWAVKFLSLPLLHIINEQNILFSCLFLVYLYFWHAFSNNFQAKGKVVFLWSHQVRHLISLSFPLFPQFPQMSRGWHITCSFECNLIAHNS